MSVVCRVLARVFASEAGGGNPVTIFRTTDPLSSSIQSSLAQSCEWESVVTSPGNNLTFFMPSGEQVSFCAHAAMGASYVINGTASANSSVEFYTGDFRPQIAKVDTKSNEVGLMMDTVYQEVSVDATPLLLQCGINLEHVVSSRNLNASVARYKTLVQMVSVDALHKVSPPTNPDAFRNACDNIDSTGLYLYSKSSSGFECRQFPRNSGYPEDPATGIAAAALAVHLHPTYRLQQYNIYQGTAMGRPSLIQIRNIHIGNDNNIKLECWGQIEVDLMEDLKI